MGPDALIGEGISPRIPSGRLWLCRRVVSISLISARFIGRIAWFLTYENGYRYHQALQAR